MLFTFLLSLFSLICGKYFQGCGISTCAYNHSLEESHHFRNSTVDTICQLLNITLREFKSNIGEYCKKVQTEPIFTKIIPATIDYFETEHYIFTHGYIPCFYTGRGLDKIYSLNIYLDKSNYLF